MNEMELTTRMQPSFQGLVSNPPNISNLSKCIEEVKNAALDKDLGPDDPTNYDDLKNRLEASREKLPPLYRKEVLEPFVKALNELGAQEFNKLLALPDDNNAPKVMMMDIAQAILQHGERYNKRATDAFQEVVSDLYDGFLSKEDRSGIKPPDKSVIPPLVKWGNPEDGPYTWPVDDTVHFGLGAAIVNLPPSNAKHGLLAWAALGHETGGHDILHADEGLLDELSQAVRTALQQKNIGNGLPDYWADRIDETASDVMGILNMGPAAGIGLIGYFRGLNLAFTGKPILRNVGPQADPHPADILRGFLAAAVVRSLEFNDASSWAKIIEDETNKDVTKIMIQGREISAKDARDSAGIVASAIMNTKVNSLENHNLAQIQNWRNEDESIVRNLWSVLSTTGSLPTSYDRNTYATHVVAAAVTKAVSADVDIPVVFERMQSILKIMHDSNPSWGPLYVRHPGNVVPHYHYIYSEAIQGNVYH